MCSMLMNVITCLARCFYLSNVIKNLRACWRIRRPHVIDSSVFCFFVCFFLTLFLSVTPGTCHIKQTHKINQNNKSRRDVNGQKSLFFVLVLIFKSNCGVSKLVSVVGKYASIIIKTMQHLKKKKKLNWDCFAFISTYISFHSAFYLPLSVAAPGKRKRYL